MPVAALEAAIGLPRLAALALAAVVPITWGLGARGATGWASPQAGGLDEPLSVAANAEGDVYVSYRTGAQTGAVRRFSSDGLLLSAWETRWFEGACDIAESGHGGLWAAFYWDDALGRYDRQGVLTARVPVDGLEGAVATVPGADGLEAEVLAIVTVDDLWREVRRFAPDGEVRGGFRVPASARDLAVLPPTTRRETSVLVAEAPRTPNDLGRISRYSIDGTKESEWQTCCGEVAGMDADIARDRLWIGRTSEHARLWAYTRDGNQTARCELPAYPIDVAVGRDGDLFVLAATDPPPFSSSRVLVHLGADCTVIDTWDLRHLNALPRATATWPPPPSPSATPTLDRAFDAFAPVAVRGG